MLMISIKSKRFDCELVLHKKVTVIQGLSGTGKTRLCEALADTSGAYKVQISDNYEPMVVPNKYWYEVISDGIQAKRRRVYIIDDTSYISTPQFSKLFSQEKFSFFILINRFSVLQSGSQDRLSSLNRIPFCINEIYELASEGKKHWLSPLSSKNADVVLPCFSLGAKHTDSYSHIF